VNVLACADERRQGPKRQSSDVEGLARVSIGPWCGVARDGTSRELIHTVLRVQRDGIGDPSNNFLNAGSSLQDLSRLEFWRGY